MWNTVRPMVLGSSELREAIRRACSWLTDIAQIKRQQLTDVQNSKNYEYQNWRGALRNEYSAATRQWDSFAPVWHTGQAVKALCKAYQVLGDPALLQAARLGAGFIGNQRVNNEQHPWNGLILAFEDQGDAVNTSGILECGDGLLLLSEITGDPVYRDWIIQALQVLADHMYIPGEGLFRDNLAVSDWQFFQSELGHPGRPLIDDAMFLRGYQLTGKSQFKNIFYETADRLLAEEEPAGNWIRFRPCSEQTGLLHPRHAYWWGLPMLLAFRDSGERKYLDCAVRAGQWYVEAQRRDGGLFRNTDRAYWTDSFGHATSGIACAGILWHNLWKITREDLWLAPLRSALNFCAAMQFVNPADPNLNGAVLEKVQPPDGTDGSPYYLRDLGTTFFVQFAAIPLLEANPAIATDQP